MSQSGSDPAAHKPPSTRDPDRQKGAVEGDRPDDKQFGNPHGPGVDENGLPNDPVGTAEDRIGANEDGTEG